MIYKSMLFVPAKEKMLSKISSLNSDAFIIDLEDSIPLSEKNKALEDLCNWLDKNNFSNIIVRVNKDNYEVEITRLIKYNVDFMLPKIEDVKYYNLKYLVDNGKKVYGLVESPMGLINIDKIASCENIYALAFGAEDYSSFIGMDNNSNNLLYAKCKIVNYARAYNKLVYDTPSFEIENVELFKKEVDVSRSLGFDGKLIINPKHIVYVNEKFNDIDLETIESIIKEYDSKDEAVQIINGKVYEKMHINHMKKILKERKNQ